MSNKKRKTTILFDKLVGEPVFNLLSKSKGKNKPAINKKKIKNILLIRPGGIGDFLLNIPAFKELKRKFPKSKIDILLFKRNEFCRQYYSNFNKITVIDKPKELAKFILSKKNYEVCIDFDQHRKIPSILCLLSKAPVKIGFKNNGKEKAYDFSVGYSNKKYEAKLFLDLLKPLHISKSLSENNLILVRSGSKKKNSVGIYASAMKEDNRLPIEKWKEIINKVGKNKKYHFFGGSKDKERYDLIQNELRGFKIHRRDGKCNLMESLKEISKMENFISEDGGVYHMAVCSGVSTISYWLHGEENMDKWKAPFNKHRGILVK